MACVKCGVLVCVLVTATCLLAILNPSSPSHLLLCCEPIVLPQPTYSSLSIDRGLGLGGVKEFCVNLLISIQYLYLLSNCQRYINTRQTYTSSPFVVEFHR